MKKIEVLQFENIELKDKFKNLEKSTEADKERAKEELIVWLKRQIIMSNTSGKNNIKMMGIAGERESTESLVIKVQSVLQNKAWSQTQCSIHSAPLCHWRAYLSDGAYKIHQMGPRARPFFRGMDDDDICIQQLIADSENRKQ